MKLKHLKVPGKVLKFRQICGFMKSHCEYYIQQRYSSVDMSLRDMWKYILFSKMD